MNMDFLASHVGLPERTFILQIQLPFASINQGNPRVPSKVSPPAAIKALGNSYQPPSTPIQVRIKHYFQPIGNNPNPFVSLLPQLPHGTTISVPLRYPSRSPASWLFQPAVELWEFWPRAARRPEVSARPWQMGQMWPDGQRLWFPSTIDSLQIPKKKPGLLENPAISLWLIFRIKPPFLLRISELAQLAMLDDTGGQDRAGRAGPCGEAVHFTVSWHAGQLRS